MPRLTTMLVWVSTALAALLLVALPVSYWWGVSQGLPWGRGAFVGANNGELLYWGSTLNVPPMGLEVYRASAEPMTAHWIESAFGHPFTFRLGSFAAGRFDESAFAGFASRTDTVVVVPIWFPALVLAVPGAWRWRRGRRGGSKGFEVVVADHVPETK